MPHCKSYKKRHARKKQSAYLLKKAIEKFSIALKKYGVELGEALKNIDIEKLKEIAEREETKQ